MRKIIITAAIIMVTSAWAFAEQVGEYFHEDQNIGQAGKSAGGNTVSIMATKLPYAYYPSKKQMEVAIELGPELLKKSGTAPKSVDVRIISVKTGQQCATGVVSLDKKNRGQTVFEIPDLPDGEYAVEYVIGNHVERSPRTFKRIHFPFEKIAFGKTHEVYPPFEPVKVNENTVSVVGRTYTVNAAGLFDSVISLGRELLGAPMKLIAETADGKQVEWQKGDIKGRELYPDEALFETETQGSGIKVQSSVTVNEDGCAKIAMTLMPDTKKPVTVSRLYVDIALKDSEVPLFHYIADNGMRFNYGGRTPRGGKIEWYKEKWDANVPLRWRVVQAGNDDGVIWTSSDTRQHDNIFAKDHRPFVPYIWLGAEERGLAFFMENEKSFATNYKTPVQKIIRNGDRVIIRVEIFQKPETMNGPRTITFGLMASPGKPMEKDFRSRPFANCIGPVVCWGGWMCASKYPDNQDWSIVDKIQEIRKRGKITAEDQAWLDGKYKEVKARWPDRLMQDDPKAINWLQSVTKFAQRAPEGRNYSGIYFEEHATDTRLPEWEVFQDEWASAEFNRFRDKPANWGVFSPSYHDFVLYMANEWMKRGVSIYFDNTNPKRCYNERFGPAYRTPDGSLVYGISIFGQRDYYRRIYKLLCLWNANGVEYQIDSTLHVTNTQTLPFNTWATATLDLEQRSHTEDPGKVPAEVVIEKKGANDNLKLKGYQLPWPPDYTRTVTFGRQTGTIPLALDFVSGHLRHDAGKYTSEMLLRNWAMCRIHDIRSHQPWPKNALQVRQYDKVFTDFGYGKLDQVEHHNYWVEKPFVTVNDDRIKWMALTKIAKSEPFGLLLLQSYSRTETIIVPLVFPGAAALMDIETKEIILTQEGKAQIAMPANFATRMFLVAHNTDVFKTLPAPK